MKVVILFEYSSFFLEWFNQFLTQKNDFTVQILRCSRRLFIILVSLTMTRFSEKCLFPLDAYIFLCPTWSKNLGRTLLCLQSIADVADSHDFVARLRSFLELKSWSKFQMKNRLLSMNRYLHFWKFERMHQKINIVNTHKSCRKYYDFMYLSST